MTQAAKLTVDAPARRGPMYSLLLAAPTPTVVDDDVWAGWQFTPEALAFTGAGRLPTNCIGDTTADTVPATRPAVVDGDPFLVYATDQCSSLGWQAADYMGRARRALELIQSAQIAEELWDGSLSGTLSNTPLTSLSSDQMTTSAVSIRDAFALIEQGIARQGRGQQGMIHMTPQLLAHAHAEYLIDKVGNLWMSPMGNIVVADAGYSGNGPFMTANSTSQWIYGTSVIEVLLGPIEFLPAAALGDNSTAFMWEALDRTTNKVVVTAERLAGYRWDESIHVAAQVNVGIPAYGGS